MTIFTDEYLLEKAIEGNYAAWYLLTLKLEREYNEQTNQTDRHLQPEAE